MFLEVKNLNVEYHTAQKISHAVKGASFSMEKGEILGIVGESGSGKSTMGLTLMMQLPQTARFSGEVIFKDRNLVPMNFDELREIRGKEISVVFQEPMTSLNPLVKVGKQVEEILILHDRTLSKEVRKDKVLRMFANVELENPEEIYGKYPHELSGGMQQRVMIAMALLNHPELLIADEPTTAIDADAQAQVLKLLLNINKYYGTGIILISHDLNVIRKVCTRALVMYKGKIVEDGSIEQIFNNPKDDYTKKLIAAISEDKKEVMENVSEPCLSVRDMSITRTRKSNKIGVKPRVKTLCRNMSFDVRKGEILGLVGESGSGKSTLCRTILGLHDEFEGSIKWGCANPQMIFQDSAGSLNPARKIGWILEEPLKNKARKMKKGGQDITTSAGRKKLVKEMMQKVELPEELLTRYPGELSGGQKQRVNIALALIGGADFIVADEPVSALDVTIQDQILKLLLDLQKEFSLSMLFISHDKAVVERMCDRIIYMKDYK